MHNRALNRRRLKPLRKEPVYLTDNRRRLMLRVRLWRATRSVKTVVQIHRHEFNPAALPPFPDGEWFASAEL